MPESMIILLFMCIYLAIVLTIVAAEMLIGYIFQAIGLSAIAKRRGIENPWLAWVPVAGCWTLGSVSDQFRCALTGEDRNFRKKLLVRRILMLAATNFYMCILFSGVFLVFAVQAGMREDMQMLLLAVWWLLVAAGEVLFYVFAVRNYIVQYKVLFDFYRSCDPKTSVIFFVLSFFSNIALSLGFLLNRDKDLGMPPKPKEISTE